MTTTILLSLIIISLALNLILFYCLNYFVGELGDRIEYLENRPEKKPAQHKYSSGFRDGF